MRYLKLLIVTSLIFSGSICASKTKIKSIHKKKDKIYRISEQELKLIQKKHDKPKICTPKLLTESVKIAGVAITSATSLLLLILTAILNS